MESTRIKDLLEKYWNCETSLEEEKELKQYFLENEGDISNAEQALFKYYREFSELKPSPNQLDKLESKIKSTDTEPQPQPKRKGKSISFLPENIQTWQIAAAIAGIFVASVVFQQMFYKGNSEVSKVEEVLVADTYQDPEVAFEETKKALQLIAQHLNTGKKQVEKIKVLHEAEQTVKNTDNEIIENESETEKPK